MYLGIRRGGGQKMLAHNYKNNFGRCIFLNLAVVWRNTKEKNIWGNKIKLG